MSSRWFGFLRRKSFWAILVLLVVLVLLLRISAGGRGDITVTEKALRDFFSPAEAAVMSLRDKVAGFRLSRSAHDELEQKLAALTQENERLILRDQLLWEEQAELLRLRELFALSENYGDNFTLQAARVIARSPGNWYQMISIDKGSRDGIATDMAVIAPNGLVGRVGGVSSHSAQVWLLSDREVTVGVMVQETRDSQGIVEGLGGGNQLLLANVPYYADLNLGQHVITSGLSDMYPKGILVGTIKSIEPEANGLLLSAEIIPAVDFDKLEEVLVVTQVKVVEEWPADGE